MTDRRLHVVLVEPEIPWNTGNIGRTCLAVGAQLHLVRPMGFSLEATEVRRAGLDYWSRVAPKVWTGWQALEAALPTLGTPFFISPEGTRTLWEVTFSEPVVLLFGKEGAGFSQTIRARYAEHLVSLPMQDPLLRSINVSTCAGIVMYEVLRQWQIL